ncbi:MAG: hypothetical protein IT204_03040 [Fimbriimonadaceae bacterium]|nr:hypothetical protein [Fimbriimonadaceae bacterium]
MKRVVAAAVLVAAVVSVSFVARAALPADVAEFRDRLATEATTPEGALHCWFEALFVYQAADTHRSDDGAAMLDLVCADPRWQQNELFLAQLRTKPFIFRSYCVGAEPANSYQMDPDDFALRYGKATWQDDRQTCILELLSSGADRPRPVRLVKLDEQWWVKEYGALYAGVQEPAE